MMPKIFSIIILFFLASNLFGQEKNRAGFFITENPAQLEIIDQYQQKLSDQDKLFFRPFTPWQIIKGHILLSDQFSAAMEVEFAGKTYFFALDEKGRLVSDGEPGLIFNFADVEKTPGDFQVIQNKAVLFSKIPFKEKNKKYKRTYLEKGQKVQTIFKMGPDYFVLLSGSKKQYGWIRPSGRLSLRKESGSDEAQGSTTVIESDILNQLSNKVEAVNRVYKKLFQKLNSEKNQNKPAPYWSLESNTTGIVLELQNNQSGKFKKSISYFVNEVETLFSGNEYEIYSSGSAIEILKK
jgi:hypothetical protein